MEKYYDVVFYGEIHDGKDLSQVKHLITKIVGKSESEIEHFFSGNKVLLKKCPSYDHAKKYADLFEKVGAKVKIEQIGIDKSIRSEKISSAQAKNDPGSFTAIFLKNPRILLTGVVLLFIGFGIGFLIAIQYFSYQNLSVITPITAQPSATQIQKSGSSDTMHESSTEPAQSEKIQGIEEEITELEKQIQETGSEDQKYAGGLIKAIIGSQLATLKQTHAMLQQRAKASLFRIGLKYTVDGQPFTPPQDVAVQLGIVERELAELATKIAAAEAEAARYSGGLIQAVSLSTVAQMKQTQAMLDQKRLALKFSLPQYIGFKDGMTSIPSTNSITTNKPEESSTPQEKQWRIVEIDSKVTESNDSWWRYAWRLTLANDSQQSMVFNATIEFQDADGFVIDQDSANRLVVPPTKEETFTGYTLVRVPGALKVQKTLAKIGVH